MNAFTPVPALRVRQADFDRGEDRRQVASFVRAHAEGTFFHLPEWSVAVERGCGQRSRCLVAEDAAGQITGLLPLTEVRSPLFGSALASTGFGVGGGILADDPATADRLAEEAWALAGRLGCQSVELRGGPVPSGWQRSEGTYAGFARDLPRDAEDILKSIPRKQRAEVRRALGGGFKVCVGATERDRSAHYRVYSESVRNLGTPVFPRSLFDAVLDTFGADADILTVFRDSAPISSVLSLYFKGTVYPYWGGGTYEARGARTNELMYYELMRHAAARGCTRFDFGRSKVGTGPYAYKKNWGFEPEPLAYAYRGESRETNPLSPKYRLQVALWKKLPLGLANLVGPPIARGLG